MSECLCFCNDPVVFPKRPANRAGLERINYRIGAYADFRAEMLRRLNLQPVLHNWTHREPDDPGIALIEGAAILGDILAFYQDLYANEAYLRTARWRESVAELVRLLGYRLAPGLGGRGAFAFEIKGALPVTIPAGFGISADLDGGDQPAEFETESELIAYPHLSRVKLYTPNQTPSPVVTNGATEFAISLADGETLAMELKEHDRLLIGVPSPGGLQPRRFQQSQIVAVKSSRMEFGKQVVKLKAPVALSSAVSSLAAFKLGPSHRHFGHNAPPTTLTITPGSSPPESSAATTWYFRDDWEGSPGSYFYGTSFAALQVEMPLDAEVNQLTAGSPLIVEAIVARSSSAWTPLPYTLVGKVVSTANRTLTYGNVTASVTVATLAENLLTLLGTTSALDAFRMDIRTVTFHEAASPLLRLESRPTEITAGSGQRLDYFGTASEVQAFVDRRLLLVQPEGDPRAITATALASSALAEPLAVRHRGVILDTIVDYNLFRHATAECYFHGNVADATQGKTQRQASLGNGDNRETFQTFKLPKSPLTYHPSPGGTPPQAPELEVRVNGLLWKRVDSFFGRGSKEEIYIVREDANGGSYVQFGDGEMGARLPSGINNVTAHYRAGSGAHGSLKPDAKPQPAGRLNGLDKIQLPDVISGGSEPEQAGKAREAAPGKIQSLGRLVSLRDFETETLGIAGVTKASAAWALDDGVPGVELIVLLEAGRTAEISAVRQTIVEHQHCRGPNRFPVKVIQGTLRYLYLNVQFAFDPRLEREAVEAQIRIALGAGDDDAARQRGLFAVRNRVFGEREYATRVAGYVQNVPGVRWCKVTALGLFPVGDDPAAFTLPAEPKPFNATIPCGSTEVLQLHSAHLKLIAAPPPPTDPCES
jgi:predicted phage baseplate assembly protein